MDYDAKPVLRAFVGSDESFGVVGHFLPALTITDRPILDRWRALLNQKLLS
jgi:hypothetical protein